MPLSTICLLDRSRCAACSSACRPVSVLVSDDGSKGISLSQDVLNHWQIHIDILTYAGS